MPLFVALALLLVTSAANAASVRLSPATTPGTQGATRFSHYALLHTTEEMLGLPFIGGVATAPSMRSDFNLG